MLDPLFEIGDIDGKEGVVDTSNVCLRIFKRKEAGTWVEGACAANHIVGGHFETPFESM
jgi:hypothetical protein